MGEGRGGDPSTARERGKGKGEAESLAIFLRDVASVSQHFFLLLFYANPSRTRYPNDVVTARAREIFPSNPARKERNGLSSELAWSLIQSRTLRRRWLVELLYVVLPKMRQRSKETEMNGQKTISNPIERQNNRNDTFLFLRLLFRNENIEEFLIRI